MPKINVLTRETAELIAAGEVIERPSSVIKELVENSVDAQAKHITVEIKNGGISYMRVSDDGCGIAYEDVPKAFLRHATSKIISASDLDNICTLGFRGEALASVSAVSKVELHTKQRSDEYGTYYRICGCNEEIYENQGCSDGTSIIVKDLFYNVPARQKFMKKDVSEGNAVSNIVSKIALSHPEISFRFIRSGKPEFTTSGDGDLYSAIYAIYGKTFANDMIPVDYTDNGISVKGFAVKPLYSKANRSFQNFFINRRYIKSSVCTVSLEEAYKGLIMTGKFPSCVLMIDIPPSSVDVNAHPSKLEVKFSDEKRIFDCIFFAVKNALHNSGLIYEFQMNQGNSSENIIETPEKTENPTDNSDTFRNTVSSPEKLKKEKINIGLENFIAGSEYDDIPDIGTASILKQEKESRESEKELKKIIPENDFKYITSDSLEKKKPEPVCDITKDFNEENLIVIGEIFGNYIIAECGEKMIIFDKHAGHERIIYEKLNNRNKIMDSQYLISTSEILLPEDEFETMQENTELLRSIGFEFDFSNPPFVTARAVPIFLDSAYADEATEEIAHNLYLNKINPQTQIIDDLFHSLACKSAVKSHDKNNLRELQSLAEQIYFNDNIRHCPHGRPVMFILTKKDFEKQFKRIQ